MPHHLKLTEPPYALGTENFHENECEDTPYQYDLKKEDTLFSYYVNYTLNMTHVNENRIQSGGG